MKNVPPSLHPPLDLSFTDYEKGHLEQIEENAELCYGWTFAPSWTKNMLPRLNKVFSTDACHGRTEMHGSFFILNGTDANDHIVLLAAMFVYDNESEATWKNSFPSLRQCTPT